MLVRAFGKTYRKFKLAPAFYYLPLGGMALLAGTAQAKVTSSGDLNQKPPAEAENWAVPPTYSLHIGPYSDGSLSIQEGSAVWVTRDVYIGGTGTGEILVNGDESLFSTTGSLDISRGSLRVQSKAQAITQDANVYDFARISGFEAGWTVNGKLRVGYTNTDGLEKRLVIEQNSSTEANVLQVGRGGIVQVTSGGMLTTKGAQFDRSEIEIGTVEIDGGQWINYADQTDSIRIGFNSGGYAKMEIKGGGSLISSGGGVSLGSANGTGEMLVQGWQSVVTVGKRFDVGTTGSYGGTGILTIQSGAKLNTVNSRIEGVDSSVVIEGSGSTWNNLGELDFQRGTLVVKNGGQINSQTSYIAQYRNAPALVTGSGSAWNNAGDLYVGHHNRQGRLDIENGAYVSNAHGFVSGSYKGNPEYGDFGDIVNVSGEGTVWRNAKGLTLGVNAYKYAEVNQTGGTVHVGASGDDDHDLKLGDNNDANANYFLSGGVLDLHGNDIIMASDFASFQMTGGSIRNLGAIRRADDTPYAFVQEGGRLAPGNSPGVSTFTGDYTLGQAAVLEIELADYDTDVAQIDLQTTEGIAFDFVDIAGAAVLEGTLEVLLIDAFSPVENSTFDILTATTIDVSNLTLTGEAGFSFAVVAGGQGQILQVTGGSPVPVPSTLSSMLPALLFGGCRRRRGGE